jgi:hypothetical protein
MVSYNSPAEQLEVESFFLTTAAMAATASYAIGVEKAGSYWFLSDGTLVGGGYPNNGFDSGQYAHWCAAPRSVLGGWTCWDAILLTTVPSAQPWHHQKPFLLPAGCSAL